MAGLWTTAGPRTHKYMALAAYQPTNLDALEPASPTNPGHRAHAAGRQGCSAVHVGAPMRPSLCVQRLSKARQDRWRSHVTLASRNLLLKTGMSVSIITPNRKTEHGKVAGQEECGKQDNVHACMHARHGPGVGPAGLGAA